MNYLMARERLTPDFYSGDFNTERNAVTVLTVYNCFDGTTWSG